VIVPGVMEGLSSVLCAAPFLELSLGKNWVGRQVFFLFLILHINVLHYFTLSFVVASGSCVKMRT